MRNIPNVIGAVVGPALSRAVVHRLNQIVVGNDPQRPWFTSAACKEHIGKAAQRREAAVASGITALPFSKPFGTDGLENSCGY